MAPMVSRWDGWTRGDRLKARKTPAERRGDDAVRETERRAPIAVLAHGECLRRPLRNVQAVTVTLGCHQDVIIDVAIDDVCERRIETYVGMAANELAVTNVLHVGPASRGAYDTTRVLAQPEEQDPAVVRYPDIVRSPTSSSLMMLSLDELKAVIALYALPLAPAVSESAGGADPAACVKTAADPLPEDVASMPSPSVPKNCPPLSPVASMPVS